MLRSPIRPWHFSEQRFTVYELAAWVDALAPAPGKTLLVAI